MSIVEDIEKAVTKLTPREFARFRDWFEQFLAERFDEQIASDIADGRLDRHADQAVDDHRKGRTREL